MGNSSIGPLTQSARRSRLYVKLPEKALRNRKLKFQAEVLVCLVMLHWQQADSLIF